MQTELIIATGALTLVALFLARSLIKTMGQNRELLKKYAPIIDMDNALKQSKSEKEGIDANIETLRTDYREKKEVYDDLIRRVAIFDEEIELAEFGFYKPHYDFDTPEDYKEEIDYVRDEQKSMISDKTAVVCMVEWSVEGSASKGRTMANRAIRLTTRAFNNECDAAISNVRWNNVERMQKRIEKAYDAINKLNETYQIQISSEYLDLKKQELRLMHEYKEKKQQQKEEQAEIRRQMREEAKLEKEVEKTLKEEEKYKKLLESAKAQAEKAMGAELEKQKERIAELSKALEEAEIQSARALSRAQQTRSGHVYVISNLGSFGENVYKIGMTRRLEPLDRVKELGDASVPFAFDLHAMIYSEDAPTLESALHKKFDHLRVNLVNQRKEFFKVDLSEIESEVKEISPDAVFVKTVEAREYQETQSIKTLKDDKRAEIDLPDEL